MKTTLVIGASENPERYSYKAINNLVENGHPVYALGLKPGNVAGVDFDTVPKNYTDVNTVTLYVGPRNQPGYYDYIESLNPKRVIFNPGTENAEFQKRLEVKGIQTEIACTLVLLSISQY